MDEPVGLISNLFIFLHRCIHVSHQGLWNHHATEEGGCHLSQASSEEDTWDVHSAEALTALC